MSSCPATKLASRPEDFDFSTSIILVAAKDNGTAEFAVTRQAAKMSEMVHAMAAAEEDGEVILPLEEVDEATLGFVVAYLEHHKDQTVEPIEKPLKGKIETIVSEWNKTFLLTHLVKDGNEEQHEMLLKVVMAAHYMNIEPLRDLCCCCIASIVMGKSTEQIRQTFKIENDFTPEQQARIDEEMKYAIEE